MKKIIVLFICAAALLMTLAGCAKKMQNITFTATIEKVSSGSLLVSTTDKVGFDKASVSIAPGLKLSFTPAVGQTVRITILPQIAESYPVQVRAVAIEPISSPT